jgi:predicted esterase YcpF (UPF0227 family)
MRLVNCYPVLAFCVLSSLASSLRVSINDIRSCIALNKKCFTKAITAAIVGLSVDGFYASQVNAIDAIDAAIRNSAITYSNNAKNFERMGKGDYTQGARDVSKAPAALKRRAVKGCKTEYLRSKSGLSEIECMDKTMNGDIQFMLDIYEAENKSD